MGVLTLNPVSIYGFGRGSWGASSGTLGPLTLNTTNGIYARLNSNYSGTNGASLKIKMGSAQLPGGSKVEYMRPAYVARTSSTASEAYFRGMIQNVRAGNGAGSNAVTYSGQLKLTTSFATIYGVSEKTTKSDGKVYGDGSITQADLGSLVVEMFDVATTVVQLDQVWIEVSYDEKPEITINDPGLIQDTTSPVITWSYDDDKMDQEYIDVEVYDDTDTLIHSAYKYAAATPSYRIPISLADGDYYVSIRAYQAWNYAGDAPVSDWDLMDFTIQFARPAAPVLTLTEEDSLGRVRLNVKTGLNLFGADAAEGAAAAWNNVNNAFAKVRVTSVYETGDRALLVDMQGTGSTASVHANSLIPVEEGKAYTFAFRVRHHPVDANQTVTARIEWVEDNGSGAFVSPAGTSVVDTSTYQTVSVSAVAPTGAAYARPYFTINATIDDAWHYADSFQFNVLNSVSDPAPAWSRGGLTTKPINLLSYGDSSLEGVSYWTANETGTNVDIVNTTTEIGAATERYQGENMLRVTSQCDLIKRDSGAISVTGTSMVMPKGAALQGDLMIAFVQVQTASTTVATPSGWTLIGSQAGTSQNTYAFWHVCGASEPASTTFTASVSGKNAVMMQTWSGVDNTIPIASFAKNTAVASATAFPVPAFNFAHNAPVIMVELGRRAASTVATSFTSNLTINGVNASNDILVSSTANTAAETASCLFSIRGNSGSVSTTAVTSRTLTAANTLTDGITWAVVLNPIRQTTRATLKDYEYFDFDTDLDYIVYAGVRGATSTNSRNSANRNATFIIDLYDNDKVFVNGYLVSTAAVIPGEWKGLSNILSVNEPTAKFATIRLEIDQPTLYESYYFDAISFYPFPVNLGYIEGYKEVDGPYIEIEYSEDGGVTWKNSEDVDGAWMVQAVDDFTVPDLEFLDYEIASDLQRKYRAFLWKIEDNELLQSGYSTFLNGQISLRNVWMHSVDNPVGSFYHYPYDGGGRDDTFDKQATTLQFVGREYGVARFGEVSTRSISGSLQLFSSDNDLEALKNLDSTKSLVIFRDQRGRRVKGLLTVRFTDINYGNIVSFTVEVLGLQP